MCRSQEEWTGETRKKPVQLQCCACLLGCLRPDAWDSVWGWNEDGFVTKFTSVFSQVVLSSHIPRACLTLFRHLRGPFQINQKGSTYICVVNLLWNAKIYSLVMIVLCILYIMHTHVDTCTQSHIWETCRQRPTCTHTQIYVQACAQTDSRQVFHSHPYLWHLDFILKMIGFHSKVLSESQLEQVGFADDFGSTVEYELEEDLKPWTPEVFVQDMNQCQ